EHLFSQPLIKKSKDYEKLRKLASKALSKEIYNPYHGLSKHNWKKYILTFNKSYMERPAKKYLYVLRGLMAGIYVLEKGKITPDINELNKHFKFPVVDRLVKIKTEGGEKTLTSGYPEADDLIEKLWKEIDIAKENSSLPDKPSNEIKEEANELLLEIRMSNWKL
ncbi:nucleotidyltransferase domain-containing protein, partial [Candidatus Micrarchaeota archaeon]|nr:nucleotidyltransferase domain-containing protein [Candidatus Micrarchaeota archaeon]